MKIYLFSNSSFFQRATIRREEILQTLSQVVKTTNTHDLVVTLYILPDRRDSRGTYIRNWVTPSDFLAKRGKWAFVQKWGIPSNLPQKFKLIRLRLDGNGRSFPKTKRDRYGWKFKYHSFLDHLSTLFAHELHHFRRYHLGLHPKEGEHAANRWALQHVQNLGFNVQTKYIKAKRKKRPFRSTLLKKFSQTDPFATFRKLHAGARLSIAHDPRNHYLGQTVTVLRPIRSNSKRIVVQTSDGKTWRWPMVWLKIIKDDNV